MLKELGIGVICAQKHTSMGTPQGQGKTGQIDVGRVMSHMKYVVASLEQNVRPNGARGPGGRGGRLSRWDKETPVFGPFVCWWQRCMYEEKWCS